MADINPNLSKVYSCRLNPRDEVEAPVKRHIDAQIKAGFTTREIFVDALHRQMGHTPEMFTRRGNMSFQDMQMMLQEFADYILKNLPTQTIQSQVKEQGDTGTHGEASRNLAASFLARKAKAGRGD